MHTPGAARAIGSHGGRTRGKSAEPEPELELTDREQAKIALRRALDGNNSAATVAAATALIEFDRSPDHEHVTVDDARAALEARVREIIARRVDHGMCPTCNGSGRLWDAPGQGGLAPEVEFGQEAVRKPASCLGHQERSSIGRRASL